MRTTIHQSFEPKILYTRLFKREFERCMGRGPNQLKMVVPYIGETPWGEIVNFSRLVIGMGCEFYLTTLPPNCKIKSRLSKTEAKQLSTMGVHLKIRSKPDLHSKIYQFVFPSGERSAFVGSANFSIGGFERNDETVTFFQAKVDNDKIANEINRLSGAGSPYFHNWR